MDEDLKINVIGKPIVIGLVVGCVVVIVISYSIFSILDSFRSEYGRR